MAGFVKGFICGYETEEPKRFRAFFPLSLVCRIVFNYIVSWLFRIFAAGYAVFRFSMEIFVFVLPKLFTVDSLIQQAALRHTLFDSDGRRIGENKTAFDSPACLSALCSWRAGTGLFQR